jgi:hypothetical protein
MANGGHFEKVESCVAGCILGLSFGSYIVDVVFC